MPDASETSPRFTKTDEVFNGFIKVETWDGGAKFSFLVVRASDSVVGLLVDETNDRVLLVRQHRAPMVREDNPDGSLPEESTMDEPNNPPPIRTSHKMRLYASEPAIP